MSFPETPPMPVECEMHPVLDLPRLKVLTVRSFTLEFTQDQVLEAFKQFFALNYAARDLSGMKIKYIWTDKRGISVVGSQSEENPHVR